ncbi:hypothetical protein AB0D42_25065 [Streptomyces sp. NPDC048304]
MADTDGIEAAGVAAHDHSPASQRMPPDNPAHVRARDVARVTGAVG